MAWNKGAQRASDNAWRGVADRTAAFGITGEPAAIGVAGLDRNGLAHIAEAAVGVAGNITNGRQNHLVDAAVLHGRDLVMADIIKESDRLGDRAARESWRKGVWFADFTYLATPFGRTEGGGYVNDGQMGWRNGREWVFGRPYRRLPLFIDSCGYRREITGTAPQWAHDFAVYPAAIEMLDPDGYAAWDYPADRERSLAALHELMHIFPDDPRLWPVFSIRWTWNQRAHLNFARLPGWSGRSLAHLIPLNRTQKQFKDETREKWARQAVANALVLAADPDFKWMVERFGRVMIGGMVGCECPRMARHVFTAVLCELFPDAQFWLLGQANFAVVNGLGKLGLLERVWTDGTWYLHDATCERFAFVEDGLITMHSFETQARQRGKKRVKRRETFFTLTEMMAANLRSLLSAYEGLWTWPPPEPLPLDLLDVEQAKELKSRYQAAQMELGL